MIKRIVILNGPPGSGKDTIGAAMAKQEDLVYLSSFKFDLYKATAEHYSVGVFEFIEAAQDRVRKEEPMAGLGGLSPRGALIHVSEDVCKPKFGRDYFGHQALQRVSSTTLPEDCTVMFTDGGFAEEVQVFADSGMEVVVVQLHGRGDFTNDSRNYVNLRHPNVVTYTVYLVDGEVQQAVDKVCEILEALDA
jgi:hypothetical protein